MEPRGREFGVVRGGSWPHSTAMSRPTKIDQGIEAWIRDHAGWERDGLTAIARTYDLETFPRAIAFVVKLSMLAEKHNHHPDIDIRFKTVRVLWTTHDAGGLTRLDLALAEAADLLLG
jgi:4a-hydroxytetrahydrobiopterin dehydratase